MHLQGIGTESMATAIGRPIFRLCKLTRTRKWKWHMYEKSP